jgi:hypothetical protein
VLSRGATPPGPTKWGPNYYGAPEGGFPTARPNGAALLWRARGQPPRSLRGVKHHGRQSGLVPRRRQSRPAGATPGATQAGRRPRRVAYLQEGAVERAWAIASLVAGAHGARWGPGGLPQPCSHPANKDWGASAAFEVGRGPWPLAPPGGSSGTAHLGPSPALYVGGNRPRHHTGLNTVQGSQP